MLKAMSDYLTAQKAISFGYDANLQIVTNSDQKLGLASSGTVSLRIPIQTGRVFRFEGGHHSGMKPARIPINNRPLSRY